MQLKNLMPYNDIDGFVIESLLKSESLVGDSPHATLLIDYHLEIKMWSDGTNQLYPKTAKKRVLISQFTDTCDVQLASRDPDTIIIVLQTYQSLVAVRLAEAAVGEETNYKPYFMFSVQDTRTHAAVTTVWDVFKAETVTAR